MKKKIILTVMILICVAVCMGAVFHFSAQEGEVSDSISRNFTIKVARLIMRDYDEFDEMFRISVTDQLNIFIRKVAHFSVFFAMGALVFGIAAVWIEKYLIDIVITLLCCGAYACLDEYHQMFVSGRTALVSDVFIDSAGALAGALLCLVFICAGRFLIGRFRQKGNSAPPSAS